jgi:hypothetical protein
VYKRVAALLAAFVFVLGCNKKEDLNKDLKPIDPNGPRPQIGSDNPGGGDGQKTKTPTEGAPPVVK